RQLVGHTDRTWTVRSSGRDEHLDVDRRLDRLDDLAGRLGKVGVPLRDVDDVRDEGRELVAAGQPEESDVRPELGGDGHGLGTILARASRLTWSSSARFSVGNISTANDHGWHRCDVVPGGSADIGADVDGRQAEV